MRRCCYASANVEAAFVVGAFTFVTGGALQSEKKGVSSEEALLAVPMTIPLPYDASDPRVLIILRALQKLDKSTLSTASNAG
ncbi:hypothetical protein Tco_0814754 [Tanacetum coccineum]